MKKRILGQGFEVSALGLGCMGMSEFYGPRDDAESLKVLARAMDLGVDFFDTADMYGPYHNEELLGRFLTSSNTRPKIASKFGIVRAPGEYRRGLDNSASYARKSCEASLQRLGVDYIDLYYIHRIDSNRPIEEVMQELSALVTEGKIGHIGLCEVSAETLRRAHAIHPITAVQTEYSLWSRHVEAEILPTCNELGVGFVPYSPLGRGFLTGTFQEGNHFEAGDFRAHLPRFSPDNLSRNLSLVDRIEELAKDKGCTAAQVALAWLFARGPNIVPIPGTKRIRYLEQNIEALDVQLSKADLDRLNKAVATSPVVGERYTEDGMKGLDA